MKKWDRNVQLLVDVPLVCFVTTKWQSNNNSYSRRKYTICWKNAGFFFASNMISIATSLCEKWTFSFKVIHIVELFIILTLFSFIHILFAQWKPMIPSLLLTIRLSQSSPYFRMKHLLSEKRVALAVILDSYFFWTHFPATCFPQWISLKIYSIPRKAMT